MKQNNSQNKIETYLVYFAYFLIIVNLLCFVLFCYGYNKLINISDSIMFYIMTLSFVLVITILGRSMYRINPKVFYNWVIKRFMPRFVLPVIIILVIGVLMWGSLT